MNTQNPNSATSKTLKGVMLGGVGLSVLTLGLWFGGATQAISKPGAQTESAKLTKGEAKAAKLGKLNTEMRETLQTMRSRPHTYDPQDIYENNAVESVFRYAVLDNNNFQPNIFTRNIPGINENSELTAADANTVGLARMVVLDKPGVTSDPNDPRSHIGVYLDVAGLRNAKSEAGWYEMTLMYTTKIPPTAPARPNGHAQYGTITPEDAAILAAQGTGYNAVAGHVFTKGGVDPRYPGPNDVWPNDVNNLVTFPLTSGTFNSMQMTDAHHFFELRPETNMVFPHQEFPFAGGVPALHPPLGSYDAGVLGHYHSIVPGSGPLGKTDNDPKIYGDNPDDPRDTDRFDTIDMKELEFRLRSVPSGLTEEIHRDVFMRRASFHPEENNLQTRLYLSLPYEYSLIDTNDDDVLSFEELDINGTSDGGQSNERLYFPATVFDRVIIQREINDGLIVPRFANSQRAWVINGNWKNMDGERIRDLQLAESEAGK